MSNFTHEGADELGKLAEEVEHEREATGHTPFDDQGEPKGETDPGSEEPELPIAEGVPLGSLQRINNQNSPQ